MKVKTINLDAPIHRELAILAVRKESSITTETKLAVVKHVQGENKKLEREAERKGAA